ncbi:phosphate propanoyltransferase [Paenibacillus xerothermodurans]|uniref:Phosphate propanoyltransferase n=1 Tax=Paenibacillus xerothermodurans TaxID=1977292 RepID=A0A2W1NS41_PAEXE|nr:phosphate propanoyltransferase [Paenibacillus xerothermodurans]PZE22375.1 phosphate propanoyltransferase [Paenibacillus xerothermodurans]
MIQIPLGVSARHIHLSAEHIEQLFGKGYQLNVKKQLSQPGQFAAEETVIAVGPRGTLEQIRIVGPARAVTQLEVSRTDAVTLGLNAPLRASGNIAGTPGVKLIGPAGELTIVEGLIVTARHIHFHTSDAVKWGIIDKQLLTVKLEGERSLIFERVIARVSDRYALEMHIDTDEANAAGAKTGDIAHLLTSVDA